MEAIGFTIGIMGLAGLYSICLQAMEHIDIGTNLGKDSQRLISMLLVEMYLLEKWGENTGMNADGSLRRDSVRQYPILGTDRGRLLIFGVLANIERILSDKDNLSKKYGLESARKGPSTVNPTLAGTIDKFMDTAAAVQEQTSLSQKFVWAVRDKRKFQDLVSDLGALVGKLYSLAAPEEASDERASGLVEALAKLQEFVEGSAIDIGKGLVAQQQFQNEAIEYIHKTNRSTLLEWVGAISSEEDYNESQHERQPGTCIWIFQTDAFLAFHTGASISNVLWIHGGPGTGKTFLSGSIVEFLTQRSSLPVAYFFCKNEDVEKQNTISILRSWIYQLASQREEVLGVLESFKKVNPLATENNLWDIFPQVLDSLRCCYLVVDGCDELADFNPAARHRRSGVMKIFFTKLLQAIKSSTTKLVIVSRDEPIIRSCLITQNGQGANEYAISPDDTEHDIRIFARAIITSIQIEDRALEEQFIDQLSASCQGMFLWVRLEGERLEKGMDTRDLHKILSSMPRGLGHSYERNLRKIARLDEEMKHRAQDILRWLLFATRPLSVIEIFHLLDSNDESVEFDPTSIPFPITDHHIRTKILNVCGSLVQAQGGVGVEPADKKIHFLHFSAKEFLLSRQNQIDHTDLADFFYPAAELNHGILACACLSLLLADTQPEAITYAVDYPRTQWMEHLRLSAEGSMPVCRELQKRLFVPGLAFTRWIDTQQPGDNFTPLDAACWFGLSDIFNVLPKPRLGVVNPPRCRFGNALHIAALTGNLPFVQHLLSNGIVHVNSASGDGWTALHIASANGYERMVEYLLTRPNLNVNAVDEYGETPLFAAVNAVQVTVVALLLSRHDININTASRRGSTALGTALIPSGGMSERFMLRWGTYANPTGLDCMYAVQGNNNMSLAPVAKGILQSGNRDGSWSVEYHRRLIAIVKLLLTRLDLNINYRDRSGRTALFIASEMGNAVVVQRLLARDLSRDSTRFVKAVVRGVIRPFKRHFQPTDIYVRSKPGINRQTNGQGINGTDYQGRTPLCVAAACGHESVIELLLTRQEIDVNFPTTSRCTPIFAAAIGGHTAVVEQFLARDEIDLNFPNEDGCTPLFGAAAGGHAAVVKQLLALPQTDTNAVNLESFSPLYTAAMNGHTSVVDLLLARHDIDVNLLSKERCTPLFAAAIRGHAAVVERLITLSHTNVNITRASDGWSPLQAAIRNGSTAVVEQLLTREDTDINAPGSDGWPPIYVALNSSRHAIAERLLRRPDINVDYTDKYQQTLLHLAAGGGSAEAVSILIARDDVDINSPCMGGRTPLFAAARADQGVVVEILLGSKNLDIDRPDDQGCTPIVIAGRRSNDSIVESMLSRDGINVSASDVDGITLLHIAAISGNSDLVRRLISRYDVDINAVTANGWSPINFAALGGHEETVRTLFGRINVRLDWPVEHGSEHRDKYFTPKKQRKAREFLKRLQLEMNMAGSEPV